MFAISFSNYILKLCITKMKEPATLPVLTSVTVCSRKKRLLTLRIPVQTI